MKPFAVSAIIFIFLGSLLGGVFVFKQEKKIIIENTPAASELTPGVDEETPGVEATSTREIQISTSTENIAEDLILQAEILISEAQKFIKEERAKSFLIEEARGKSGKIKGIYAGKGNSRDYFKNLLNETELNGLVIDIKEAYGQNLPVSLKSSIQELHKQGNWAIARIVVFRDSSLIEEKPDWYLTTTTDATTTTTKISWRDNTKQYWFDPKNEEVRDYIIEFSKKAIDYGFDELQFDYIRYPDDYKEISGQEKISAIGDFFSKISSALREYKPSVILSVDLFGYVATQFNSYGTGQRLIDAGKYFDYISFMLYPSHFYGGFAAKGVSYSYPEVVEHPYEVVHYSIISAQDYLSSLAMNTKIRPWLQDFNLAGDSDRGVTYDSEKVRLQIEGAENATSSGWLLWNPLYNYTEEALK